LDFHPNVPQDPGVFDDQYSFGRDLAPITGKPPGYVSQGLIDAANWLTSSLGIQGYRLDDAKGVSTDFMVRLLNQGALAGKFAVAEFFDGNVPYTQSWMNAVQNRSSVFDFSLRFTLADMCNNPGTFDMSVLDHTGLTGVNPMGSVTFVENHDTDQNFPIVQNKLLAYAYILTSEGYPSIFYRDYSTDRNCFGLKPEIDRLIWIHEHLAEGPTQQRWKDLGVFAFERLGGGHLLVALNKDPNTSRYITVQTGFPQHTQLQDFAGHGPTVTTDAQSNVGITVPRNQNGAGYVCYARPTPLVPFAVNGIYVVQDYEGASDLDIKPATSNEVVSVCRVFAEAHQAMHARLFFDASKWTPTTSIRLDIMDPGGAKVASRTYNKATVQDDPLTFVPPATGFHAFHVQSANTPADDSAPSYKLQVSYRAPQTL
jgi:alpha-amylase